MKIVFLSNYLNHHQIGLCDELEKFTGAGNFVFVESERMSAGRVKLGYPDYSSKRKYVFKTWENSSSKTQEIIDNADVIINTFALGLTFIKKSQKAHKPIFWYNERLFKDRSFLKTTAKWLRASYFFSFGFNRNQFSLCASNYCYHDLMLVKPSIFRKNSFAFGYFPVSCLNNTHSDNSAKEFSLLFLGRLIKWKHPEYAILCAKHCLKKGFCVKVTIVGTGPEEDRLRKLIAKNNLSSIVTMVGPCPADKAGSFYSNSDCFLFSSDKQEGWGAVLNEAMSFGCVPIASIKAGSSLCMVKEGKNGFLFKNKGELIKKIELAYEMKQRGILPSISKESINTIDSLWNYKTAARRLFNIFTKITKEEGTQSDYYGGEPLSNEDDKLNICK